MSVNTKTFYLKTHIKLPYSKQMGWEQFPFHHRGKLARFGQKRGDLNGLALFLFSLSFFLHLKKNTWNSTVTHFSQTLRKAQSCIMGQWVLIQSGVMINWRRRIQIKEWSGISLQVARKQLPVILIARQKHCRMPSNTTGGLHKLSHAHTRIHTEKASSEVHTHINQWEAHIHCTQTKTCWQPSLGVFSCSAMQWLDIISHQRSWQSLKRAVILVLTYEKTNSPSATEQCALWDCEGSLSCAFYWTFFMYVCVHTPTGEWCKKTMSWKFVRVQ